MRCPIISGAVVPCFSASARNCAASSLIEENGCLGGLLVRRIPEWLPHIHDRQTDPFRTPLAQKCEELIHAFLGAVLASEPDRAPPLQVAHHNAVGMAFADRDLVNSENLGPRMTRTLDLLTHVLHLERLDGLPIEKVLLGHILYRRVPTASTNMKSEALGVEWIVGQPVKPLLLHPLAAPAVDPTDIDHKVDAHTSTGEISDPAQFAVVPPPVVCDHTSRTWFF
jgi:hypothetical protein